MRKCNSGTISSCTQSDVVSAGGGRCLNLESLGHPGTYSGDDTIQLLIMFASQRRLFLEVIVSRKISFVPMVNNSSESQLHL